jgi:lipoprotein-anchoring transpeptidase ErfK/SrfK
MVGGALVLALGAVALGGAVSLGAQAIFTPDSPTPHASSLGSPDLPVGSAIPKVPSVPSTLVPSASPSLAPTPQAGQDGKVIVVSIEQQRLTAYQDGTSVLTTVVATGRPELPTPKGTFHVMAKYAPYTFVSPWPKGDPYWYPTVTVSWAMLFADGGYFLHDSPHRTLYGPGANLTNGSHGCVNIPLSAMGRLYAWASVGTTVVIE